MGRGNGQVQIRTRSGTNQCRGSAVWNVQNSALDANTWTNNRAGAPRDWRNLHENTVSFGGPIIRNKMFFFALWDQGIVRTRAVTNPVVLTPCARNGIFRYFDNWSNGNAIAVTTLGGTPTRAIVDVNGNPVRPGTNPDGSPYNGNLRYASVFGPLANIPTRPDCSDAVVQGSPGDSNRRAVDPTGFVTNTLFKHMPQTNNYEVGDGAPDTVTPTPSVGPEANTRSSPAASSAFRTQSPRTTARSSQPRASTQVPLAAMRYWHR